MNMNTIFLNIPNKRKQNGISLTKQTQSQVLKPTVQNYNLIPLLYAASYKKISKTFSSSIFWS